MVTKMFGDIWPNVAIVVNFWDAGSSHKDERDLSGVTEETYTTELQKTFK